MDRSEKLRKGKQEFRPRARLVSVLGEHLIRDAKIGIQELVKNGYDADADVVIVHLLNLTFGSEEKTVDEALKDVKIIVEDDGIGMDLETVLGKWLEPATGHKDQVKVENVRTPKGRLPLGEKGVGRFASHKLGRKLELISRAIGEDRVLSDTEILVIIDWDDFDDPEKYLNKVKVNFEERAPEHFTEGSGTRLIMTHARALWKEADVARVSSALRRMMSPFRTPASFEVRLVCPDFPKYQDLDPGELLETAHANLTVIVDENGIATYDYSFGLNPFDSRTLESTEIDLRMGNEDWLPADRKPECGGFYVTFSLWDRSRTNLQLSGTNVADLNKYNGVSVFRDGIRVMPYGEPEDDWLEIDKARYLRTSEAISRKNVVGAVEINQAENKNLIDKSNREGFIENEAFHDFYNLMLAVVQIAHKEFSSDRGRIREAEKVQRKEMIPAVTQLESSVERVNNALDDTLNLTSTFEKQKKIDPEVANELKANLEQARAVLQGATEETRQAAADTLTTFDEQREMLLTLAGLGLAAERFTHEFARLTREGTLITRKIARSADIREMPTIVDYVQSLETVMDALHDLVITLSPMFYVRRKTRLDDYHVKTLIESAVLLNQGQLRVNKINLEVNEDGGRLFVRMRRSGLIQVFNNLIDNSCFWLSRTDDESNRLIRITILTNEDAVIVSDNGPGIRQEDRHRVFDAFFTTKVNGRGLGLFIAREVLAENKSTIQLIDADENQVAFESGATFRVQFSDDITSTGE